MIIPLLKLEFLTIDNLFKIALNRKTYGIGNTIPAHTPCMNIRSLSQVMAGNHATQ